MLDLLHRLIRWLLLGFLLGSLASLECLLRFSSAWAWIFRVPYGAWIVAPAARVLGSIGRWSKFLRMLLSASPMPIGEERKITRCSRSRIVNHPFCLLSDLEKQVRGRRPIPSSCFWMPPTGRSLSGRSHDPELRVKACSAGVRDIALDG